MSKNKKVILTVLLLIVMFLTLLLFLGIGNGEKNESQIFSIIFILLDELIAYGVIILLCNKKNNTFSIAGISSCTFIYIMISLIYNILLSNIFNTVKSNLIFNFTILLVYAFIVSIVIMFKKENENDE